MLLVSGVVYAHTLRASGNSGGLDEPWLVDRPHHPLSGGEDASPLAARWLSVIRPWAMPLLFWVSGAALACSYKKQMKYGALLGFGAAGIVCNALLWWLSPRDPACGPSDACAGRGVLFDFAVVHHSGHVFPYVFQMWYVIALVLMMLVNTPLVRYLATPAETRLVGGVGDGTSRDDIKPLLLQYGVSALLIVVGVTLIGRDCPSPTAAVAILLLSELCFLGLVALLKQQRRGFEACFLELVALLKQQRHGLSTRTLHYALAATAVLQFAVPPFARTIDDVSASFVVFALVGFNMFFLLGFLMTRARTPHALWADAAPTASRLWPVSLFGWVLCAPSTNWMLAGNLTYPYFPATLDRVLYVTGAVITIFAIDRASRVVECVAVPGVLNKASLGLYLFHPLLITLLMQVGVTSPAAIWALCQATAIAAAAGRKAPRATPPGSRDDAAEGLVTRPGRSEV